MKRLLLIVLPLLAVFLSLDASAAVDVTAVVNSVKSDVEGGITSVGGMMLALAGLAMTYRWLKAMFF